MDTPSLPGVIPGVRVSTKAARVGLPIHQVLDKTVGQVARSLGAGAWPPVAGKGSGK